MRVIPENDKKLFGNIFFIYLDTFIYNRLCSMKKVFLEISQNSQENTCARVSFLIKFQLYWKRDSSTGVFLPILLSFKNTFFYRTPLVVASVNLDIIFVIIALLIIMLILAIPYFDHCRSNHQRCSIKTLL